MASAHSDQVLDAPLPSYLARHTKLGFNSDDVAALLSSIDSSQDPQPSSLSQLPAELLLQILEYVPVDHVLDWRLVCRGFRDAIDGRVLYHHLHRTELIGYMGSKDSRPMEHLTDEQFHRIRLLHAQLHNIEKAAEATSRAEKPNPIWSSKYAIFHIDDKWFDEFRDIGGAATRGGHVIEDADVHWFSTLDRLELSRPEQGFGTLRWCIKLDHAVLDLDFHLEKGRHHFDVDINLHTRRIRVEWKAMLFRFLKTERSLRRLMEQKPNPPYTFSHFEDCLRSTRRTRLHSALNPSDKIDRHIAWSMRLLRPLFGTPRHDPQMTLEDVENDATSLLLLLRREASMTPSQLSYLHRLATEYQDMTCQVSELEHAFAEFKGYLSLSSSSSSSSSGLQMRLIMPFGLAAQASKNPIAWTDEVRARVEELVGRWKGQRDVVERMREMLVASNVALGMPEDSFDDVNSEF